MKKGQVSFEHVKNAIISGKVLDVTQCNFALNDSDSEIDVEFHDSSGYEKDITIVTQETLAHIAIQSENIPSLIALMQAGIDIKKPLTITITRKQRDHCQWKCFFGPLN